jgi:hypothetical protein
MPSAESTITESDPHAANNPKAELKDTHVSVAVVGDVL